MPEYSPLSYSPGVQAMDYFFDLSSRVYRECSSEDAKKSLSVWLYHCGLRDFPWIKSWELMLGKDLEDGDFEYRTRRVNLILNDEIFDAPSMFVDDIDELMSDMREVNMNARPFQPWDCVSASDFMSMLVPNVSSGKSMLLNVYGKLMKNNYLFEVMFQDQDVLISATAQGLEIKSYDW